MGYTTIKSDGCMSLTLLGSSVRHKCTEISNLCDSSENCGFYQEISFQKASTGFAFWQNCRKSNSRGVHFFPRMFHFLIRIPCKENGKLISKKCRRDQLPISHFSICFPKRFSLEFFFLSEFI